MKSLRFSSSAVLLLAISGCAMPPSAQQSGTTASPAAPQPALPAKPLNHRDVDAVIHNNKSIVSAERQLVGKPVALKMLNTVTGYDPKLKTTFIAISPTPADSTIYSCVEWDKSIEQVGWVNATVASVSEKREGVLKTFFVRLTGCTKGSAPPDDPSVVPMKAQELEAIIKANKSPEKSTSQLAEKLVELKVLKQYKWALPTNWAFQSIKPRREGDFVVAYSCPKWDKSFKVGATVYGTLESVNNGMDENDVGVSLSSCRTKR